MFIAVVLRGAMAKDRSCCQITVTGEDREAVIKKAIEDAARRQRMSRFPMPFRILVGELTSEVLPPRTYTEVALKAGD